MPYKAKCPSCKKNTISTRYRFLGTEYIRDPKFTVPVLVTKTLLLCDECAKRLGLIDVEK